MGLIPIVIAYAPGYEYTENYFPDSSIMIGGLYGSNKPDPYIIPVGPGTSFCQNSFKSRKIVGHQGVDFSIKLGPGASKKKFAWSRGSTILEGIHVFYSTLAHEVEHAQIFYDNWKDGYSLDLFDEDKDKYYDLWEISIANLEMDNSTFHKTPQLRFTIHVMNPGKDAYNKNYNYQKLFENPPYVGHSAGTEYEEWRCLKKEYLIFNELNLIDDYDWSYDPPNIQEPKLRTQGKQW